MSDFIRQARWPSGLRRCVQEVHLIAVFGRGFESHSCHQLRYFFGPFDSFFLVFFFGTVSTYCMLCPFRMGFFSWTVLDACSGIKRTKKTGIHIIESDSTTLHDFEQSGTQQEVAPSHVWCWWPGGKQAVEGPAERWHHHRCTRS